MLADFSHARPCKPFCENSLTLPQLSNNLEAVTAQYVDVRMERKLVVLNTYHEAVLGSGLKT